MVELLLEHGAGAEIADKEDRTALDYAHHGRNARVKESLESTGERHKLKQ